MTELQDRDGYASFEMHVVAAGDSPRVVPLELWVCPEEDPDVIAFAVAFPEGCELVGITSKAALQFADALTQATDTEISVTDYGDAAEEPAPLRLSFDQDGCDVLFVLVNGNRRLVLDFDEARKIAAAARDAVAYLAAATSG